MQRTSPPPGSPDPVRRPLVWPNGHVALARTLRARTIPPSARSVTSTDEDGPTDVVLAGTMCNPWDEPEVDPEPLPSDFSVAPGTVVGNYRVLAPLASGGMGVVFLGEHLHLGRRVAI